MSDDNNDINLDALPNKEQTASTGFVFGPNPLTRLSPSERQQRLGVPLPDDDTITSIVAAGHDMIDEHHRLATADLARATVMDLRAYLGDIRDQGGCGSCVAFGAIAVMEGTLRWMRRVPTHPIDLSEAHLFYGWGKAEGRDCDNGWYPLAALNACHTHGVTTETLWPYTAGNTNGGSAPTYWESERGKALGVLDLTSDPEAIKQHVNDVGPVAACFVVYNDFFAYRSGVYRHASGAVAGGHCVAIIGYDDAKSAWLCRNSWGTSWGDSGNFWIGYGECGIETWQNATITGVTVRGWTGYRKVIGAYATSHDRNGWAYLEDRGWLRLGGLSGNAHAAMFEEVLSAKAGNRYIGAYENDTHVTTIYTV